MHVPPLHPMRGTGAQQTPQPTMRSSLVMHLLPSMAQDQSATTRILLRTRIEAAHPPQAPR